MSNSIEAEINEMIAQLGTEETSTYRIVGPTTREKFCDVVPDGYVDAFGEHRALATGICDPEDADEFLVVRDGGLFRVSPENEYDNEDFSVGVQRVTLAEIVRAINRGEGHALRSALDLDVIPAPARPTEWAGSLYGSTRQAAGKALVDWATAMGSNPVDEALEFCEALAEDNEMDFGEWDEIASTAELGGLLELLAAVGADVAAERALQILRAWDDQ